MTETNGVTRGEIHANWHHYVQSPDQLAFSRLSKFPPGSGSRLIEALGIEDGERILEIGCGLGILGSRLLATDRPDTVIGVELGRPYLRATLPRSLRSGSTPLFARADGFNLPFPNDSFDRLVTHTVINLLGESERKRLHDEVRRVLTSRGRISHMDGIGGESWQPDHLSPPDPEHQRRSRFFELLRDVHERIESGFVNTARDLPERMKEENFRAIHVDSYSSTLRLGNPNWSTEQKQHLLNLHAPADRDRVQRLRNLLEVLDELTPERVELLNQHEVDLEQQAQRRREAIENNRETGWRSSLTLVINVDV